MYTFSYINFLHPFQTTSLLRSKKNPQITYNQSVQLTDRKVNREVFCSQELSGGESVTTVHVDLRFD